MANHLTGLIQAVQQGRLKEERLNDAVRCTLSVKYDYGLFEHGSLRAGSQASEGIRDPKVVEIATQAGQCGVRVLKDTQKLLPLKPDQKVLLIEQINPLHRNTNSQACHPGILWENLLNISDQVAMVETNLQLTAQDYERIQHRLDEADIIVATDYYYRNQVKDDRYGQELLKLGKPVIVVTNTHYPTAVRPEYETVVVGYGVGPESITAIARTLYRIVSGKYQRTLKYPTPTRSAPGSRSTIFLSGSTRTAVFSTRWRSNTKSVFARIPSNTGIYSRSQNMPAKQLNLSICIPSGAAQTAGGP